MIVRAGLQGALLLDLDGTLVHSAHDYAALKAALGLPPDLAVLEALATFPAHARDTLLARIDAWEQDHADRCTPIEGAGPLLLRARERGVPYGILTRNTRATALRSLAAAGLTDHVDPAHVFGRDEAAPKPAPDGVHALLRALGAPREGAWMVGDGRFDLVAARAAGVLAVAFDPERSGRHRELADHVVHHLDEVLP